MVSDAVYRFRRWLGREIDGATSEREASFGSLIMAGWLALLTGSLFLDAEVQGVPAFGVYVALSWVHWVVGQLPTPDGPHRRPLPVWMTMLATNNLGLVALVLLSSDTISWFLADPGQALLAMAAAALVAGMAVADRKPWAAVWAWWIQLQKEPIGLGEPVERSRIEVHILAIHEAGHALMKALLPEIPEYMLATVEREQHPKPGTPGGFVDFSIGPWDWRQGVPAYSEWVMLDALAGQAAEKALTSQSFLTAAGDTRDWQNEAVKYLSRRCDGPYLWLEPKRSETIEANRILLERLRAEQMAQMVAFFSLNRETLRDLATLLEQRGTLDLEALKPFLTRVQRPPGLPVLPASAEACLAEVVTLSVSVSLQPEALDPVAARSDSSSRANSGYSGPGA